MQWIHLMAAVVGVGGMGFLLLILIPSLGVLSAEHREALSKAVAGTIPMGNLERHERCC